MIDTASPPGSYRAALDPGAVCAVCRQSTCGHSDLIYAGLVPAPVARPFHTGAYIAPANNLSAGEIGEVSTGGRP